MTNSELVHSVGRRLLACCTLRSGVFFLLLMLGLMFAESAGAVSPRLPVLNETTGETTTLTQISSQWSALREGADAQRRDFESLDDFEARVNRRRELFDRFLSHTYRVVYAPDSVSFDWENSFVILEARFQRNILRRRGGSTTGPNIRLNISARPESVRDISTFPQHLTVEMAFRVTGSGDFLIQDLNVFFRGDKIYEE